MSQRSVFRHRGVNVRVAALVAAVALSAGPSYSQFIMPTKSGAAVANNLSVSNVVSEYFDTAAPSSAWTVASDTQGPALYWTGSGAALGFAWENYGHGMAWRTWPVGANDFDLKFDHAFLTGSLKQPSYQSAIPQLFGAYVAVSTDPPCAQNANTLSIVATMSQAGPAFSVRQGILYYLQCTVTPSGANGVNITVNNGHRLTSAMVGTYVWIGGTGPYQIQSVTSQTTLTLASGAPVLTRFNHVTMGADACSRRRSRAARHRGA